jgi:hypothetical protein
MVARTETPQLHLLAILDLLRIAISPLHRHFTIRIRIHQHIERAISIQLWQECDRGRYLAKNRLDLGLDFSFRFLYWRWDRFPM